MKNISIVAICCLITLVFHTQSANIGIPVNAANIGISENLINENMEEHLGTYTSEYKSQEIQENKEEKKFDSNLGYQADIETSAFPYNTASEKIEVTGWFLYGKKIDRIQIFVDDQLMGTAARGEAAENAEEWCPGYDYSNAGFFFTLDTRKVPNGPHLIQARAYGVDGTTYGASMPIIIENKGTLEYIKNLELDYQADISVDNFIEEGLTGKVTVRGWFLYKENISKIDILVDEEVMGTAFQSAKPSLGKVYLGYDFSNAGYSFTLDTTKISNGEHLLTAKAYGIDGTTYQANMDIKIANSEDQAGPKKQERIEVFSETEKETKPSRLVVNEKGMQGIVILDDYGNINQASREISLDEEITGKINYTNDIDCFIFSPIQQVKISIESQNDRVQYHVLDYITKEEIEYKQHLFEGKKFIIVVVPPVDEKLSEAESTYKFKVTKDTKAKVFIQDGSDGVIRSANKTSFGKFETGSITYEDDIDYYVFVPQEDIKVIVEFNGKTSQYHIIDPTRNTVVGKEEVLLKGKKYAIKVFPIVRGKLLGEDTYSFRISPVA